MKKKLNMAVILDVVAVVREAVDECVLTAVHIAALEHARVHARVVVKVHATVAVCMVVAIEQIATNKQTMVISWNKEARSTKSIFSKEWLFQECNLHNKCVCLHFKIPISIGHTSYSTLLVLSVLVSSDEEVKALLDNWANGINSYGKIAVRCFCDAPFDYKDVTIDLNNIEEAELRNG